MLGISIHAYFPFIGFKIEVPFTSAFCKLDELGLHAGWRGHEIAWTRGDGWVVG
jgi:hypothetical protein